MAKDKKRNSEKNVFVDRSGRVHSLKGKEHGRGSFSEQREKGLARGGAAQRVPLPDAQEIRYKSKRNKPEPARPKGKHPSHPKPERRKERGHPNRPHREHRREWARRKATVDKNRKGFAFLIFESREIEDAFVSPRDADRLFHGDRVEVLLGPRGEVHDLKVLSHRFREVVGKFVAHPTGRARGGWVVYEQKRAREEIFIPDAGNHKIESEDWVRTKLHFHEKGPFPVTAEILEIYGRELPPSADVGMIAAEFSLVEEHPKAAEDEARGKALPLPIDFSSREMEGREDLRSVPFITIDGETARDFDDAVYVERNKSGYVLWVAIADVSHYVTEGSALDQDARSRGTSVYFPERAFHMLPRALSENLCSLRPNEPRLAMAARIAIDRNGKTTETRLMEAVIESRRRATYNQIQAELEDHRGEPGWEYAPHFELYEILKRKRRERGSIDFDLPEAEIRVEPTGEVISIGERARLDSHRLIEEFMIAANEAVTEWIMSLRAGDGGWPFVYRVHEEPAAESLERFEKLAATVGVRVAFGSGDPAESSQAMADLVRRLEGHPAQALLNMALLRSLKQAVYSATHGIHFGLASGAYTHFTSPIRRYPDLVVHRMLRRALRTEKRKLKVLKRHERERLEQELSDVCEHCSYRERLASDAERESIRLKQVRAMLPRLGDELEARIVGMTENGMFAQVKEPYCEGFIHRESMMDDFYIFNEDRMIFFGRRKRRTFKIGEQVRVTVLRADVDRRQIDFGLAEGRAG